MGIQRGKGGKIGFRRKYFLFLILPHILQKPLLSHDLGPTELSSPMAWLSDSGYPTASFFFFNHWVFPAAYCCYLNFFKLPDWILSLSSLAHLIYLNLPVLDYLYFWKPVMPSFLIYKIGIGIASIPGDVLIFSGYINLISNVVVVSTFREWHPILSVGR